MASRARSELVDELMDAYVDWRVECFALEEAYARWSTVALDDRNVAHHLLRKRGCRR